MSENTYNNEQRENTSAWLRENTAIHGWLTFFLIIIVAGALFSAIYGIATLRPADYAYNSGVLVFVALVSLTYVALAVYTVYLFVQRRPNAVFYGRAYVVYLLLSNILDL